MYKTTSAANLVSVQLSCSGPNATVFWRRSRRVCYFGVSFLQFQGTIRAKSTWQKRDVTTPVDDHTQPRRRSAIIVAYSQLGMSSTPSLSMEIVTSLLCRLSRSCHSRLRQRDVCFVVRWNGLPGVIWSNY